MRQAMELAAHYDAEFVDTDLTYGYEYVEANVYEWARVDYHEIRRGDYYWTVTAGKGRELCVEETFDSHELAVMRAHQLSDEILGL